VCACVCACECACVCICVGNFLRACVHVCVDAVLTTMSKAPTAWSVGNLASDQGSNLL